MSSADAIRWALTALFIVCAGLYLARVRTAPVWQSRAAWSLHTLMALAMVAMAGPPWVMRIPFICYVLVFSAGALYFSYLGLFSDVFGHALYHGAMMASMVVMALVMSATAPPAPAVGTTSAMPGMTMASGPAVSAAPPWVTLSCGVAALAFLGAALRSFYTLVQGPRRPWTNLLMTTGMGVAFAALAV